MSDEFVIVHNQVPRSRSTDDLPVYTAKDTQEQSLEERIAATPALTLPILAAQVSSPHHDGTSADEAALLARAICAAFHAAVANNQDDVVTTFVARGYISPDAPSQYLETPLLAAARCGHVGMVRALVALGARVDAYGQSATVVYETGGLTTRFQRTPLQCAAEAGHLAVVKVLVEECGADDGLVAPDGALALRLAADGGHREIVAYLPARRGGGWRRWKVKHAKQMRRAARALRGIGTFGYYVIVTPPKLLLWHTPRWAWQNRARVGGWLVKTARGIPRVLGKVPGYAWRVIKAVPEACEYAAKAAWRVLCGVPKVLVLILKWIQTGAVRVGQSVVHAVQKMASVMHTIFSAVVSFFKRITLRDVWRGVVVAAHAVFVDLPKALGKFAADAGEVTYKCLKVLFGGLGMCVYYAGVGLFWLAMYVPKKLVDIVTALGRSVANFFREVMVHIDPKRI